LYARYSALEVLGGYFPTNNFAAPREEFLSMGGFDAGMRFGEDREFCYRWGLLGNKFANVPQAVVYHAHALDFLSFLRLHFTYGGGTFHFRRRCRRSGTPPAKLSPPSWYFGMLRFGFESHPGTRGLLLAALLGLSQAASMAGLCSAAVRNRALLR
jgi:hypothetical protein